MPESAQLQRGLGFWSALTIGAGTMIGAGIFLLAGRAVELTGPAAVLSYLAAGLVCAATAASAAELATGMPTSGGDYYFVSRSLGAAFGAISGIGIWLSLTVAIAFYLVGMGEFAAQALPVSPLVAAMVGALALTTLNIVGTKQSGSAQVGVVLVLIGILAAFVGGGVFQMEPDNLTPFAPFGLAPVVSTTALIFVSFLGFVKIAAVAEEIRDPDRNLPRTLIGSVVLVTALYVLIVLVISGVFRQSEIAEVADPLTAAATEAWGSWGGRALVFAGFLATLSSANASILASSRINLAMSRDRMFPRMLAGIHPRFVTPHRALALTGALTIVLLVALPNLEELAKLASSLQLYSYAAINVGCVVLRYANPDWYRPTFRTPGFPVAQLVAAVACVAIIVFSGVIAQVTVVMLIVVSLTWFLVWGRRRVRIDSAAGHLQSRWQRLGVHMLAPPSENTVDGKNLGPVEPVLGPEEPRRVVVAMANLDTEADLMQLGRWAAAGASGAGAVIGVHVVRVPGQTPLRAVHERYHRQREIEADIIELANNEDGREVPSPAQHTTVTAVTQAAHDVFAALVDQVDNHQANLLLLGWHGGFSVGRVANSPVQRVLDETAADVAVLRLRTPFVPRRIVVPWGGGVHARLGLELAARTARATGAHIELLRLVSPGTDMARERTSLETTAATIVGEEHPATLEVDIEECSDIVDGLQRRLDRGDMDLVIIGASGDSRVRSVLFGSIPDLVADRAECSVLMVRRYLPEHWSVRLGVRARRFQEALGNGSSPK